MITTKFFGATDARGSKIVAKGFKRQLTVSYQHVYTPYENHQLAAKQLMEKVNATPGQQMIYQHELFGKWDDNKRGYIWG